MYKQRVQSAIRYIFRFVPRALRNMKHMI